MKRKPMIKLLSGMLLFSVCFLGLTAGDERSVKGRSTSEEIKAQRFLKMKAERELLRELWLIEKAKAESSDTDKGKFYIAEIKIRKKIHMLEIGHEIADSRQTNDPKVKGIKKNTRLDSTSGGISGRVTNSSGAGIQNIVVYASGPYGGQANETEENEGLTDAGGYYTILGIYPENIDVFFYRNGQNYVSEAYPVEVTVTAGVITPYINAELATGGRISGRVTNASGDGIQNISVNAWDLDYFWGDGAHTDANGNFFLSGLREGNFKVEFYVVSNAGNYLPEWYDNKDDFFAADPVAVTPGGITPDINVKLSTGGQISGRVTDASGVGIFNIRALAQIVSEQSKEQATRTEANGYYIISNLPSGNYKVNFSNGPYTPSICQEWYNDKFEYYSGDLVAVVAGSVTTGIDARLTPGGQITGRVTDASGAGIEHIAVGAYTLDNRYIDDCRTDVNGDYRISFLHPGELKVFFTHPIDHEFGSEWYNDKDRFSQADTVTVIDGSTIPNINAQLVVSGRISGRITDAAGAGIKGMMANVYDLDGNLISDDVFYHTSDANGYYSVEGLPAGECKVEFRNYGHEYVPEWFNDKADLASADTIAVAAGGTTAGINARLNAATESITVLYPEGDDSWKAGNRHYIEWSSTGPIACVGIDYSKDNGNHWIPVVASAPNNGEFLWTVPNTPSPACLVRVKDAADGTPRDASDAVFTISGRTYAICGTVVSGGSGLAGVVMSGLPGNPVTDSSGSYAAQVAAGWSGTVTPALPSFTFSPASTAYSNVTSDQYKNYEAAFQGSLVITSPVGSAKWEKGKTYPITWLKQGAQNANVKISLYKGTSTLVQVLTTRTANDGSFDWLVPKTLTSGSNYFIRVRTVDNLIKDDSDKFSIIVPTIKVTSPTMGTVWVKGTTKTITWNKTGTQDANVKIQLFKDTIKKLDITLSTPNSGSFDWAIPSTLINGTYTIRVTTLDGKVKGTSKGFSIVKSIGLTLTAPNGNELLKPIETQAIRWSQDPDVMEVKLEFSRDNGGTYATIADHAPNTGSYDWPVPVNFTRNGVIRISDASGRPWLNDGLLEYKFKFNYAGEGDEQSATLWFGGNDPKNPGYGFAQIEIGHTQVQFGGLSKTIDPLDGNWHELRIRFDFGLDTAEIRLDDQVLFENAPLGTTREHYFQPFLVLQTGGEKAFDFSLDDLAISVVRLGDEGADRERFNVLFDDFDRYDGKFNTPKSCWQWLDPTDEKSSVELGPDGMTGKSLRLCTEGGKQLMIWLPFSLPDKVPFDIADKCFNIEN